MPPTAATTALYATIRTGTELAVNANTAEQTRRLRTLPSPATALVGRATELAELLDWLAMVLGAGAFAVGLIQAFGGLGSGGTDISAAVLSASSLVWVFVMGPHMWRMAQARAYDQQP